MKKIWWLSIFLFACQPSLNRQPKFDALEGGRRLPYGVVVFGQKQEPLPMERGRTLYDIHCAVCHALDGSGMSVLAPRGFSSPGLFPLRPDGETVNVILKGKGRMYGFADRLEEREARVITAYLHALFLSQNARFSELPREDQKKLEAR